MYRLLVSIYVNIADRYAGHWYRLSQKITQHAMFERTSHHWHDTMLLYALLMVCLLCVLLMSFLFNLLSAFLQQFKAYYISVNSLTVIDDVSLLIARKKIKDQLILQQCTLHAPVSKLSNYLETSVIHSVYCPCPISFETP